MQILSNLSLYGTLGLNSVADANTDTDKFLVIDSSGIVKYRTGQELYNDIGAGGAAAYTSALQHEVKAGVAISKGQAVYVTSSDGTNMIVGKASNAAESSSSKTLGLLAQDLAINGKGFVITEGLLAGLDTSAANAEGDPVWLGTNGNLIYGLGNKPYAPSHMVFIGIVTRKNANNGEIFVKVQNGFELEELHNVQITSTPSDNAVLAYELSSGLYKMKTVPTLLGYTPTNAARTLTINGTAYDLSADRSWSVGTTTGSGSAGQVAYWNGSSSQTGSNNLFWDTSNNRLGIGLTNPQRRLEIYSATADSHLRLSGSAPSVSLGEAITSSIYQAKFGLATASGQYSTSAAAGDFVIISQTGATIWMTGTTDRLKLFYGGNFSVGGSTDSGLAKLQVVGAIQQSNVTSSMLKVDANGVLVAATSGSDFLAPGALSSYVPTSRTITINGVAYDLSADRSWTIAAGVSSFNTRTGAITLTSGDVTGALGYTPYNSSNPNGYISSYTETDTLATVTARGASTSTAITISGIDSALKVQHDGTSVAWRGRIGSFNASADKSSFLGNYTGRAGVFGHNNALSAWDDLWVNTLGIYGQGNTYLSWFTYVKANSGDTNYAIWHAGNFTPGNYLALSGGTMSGAIQLNNGIAIRDSGGDWILGKYNGDISLGSSGVTNSINFNSSSESTFAYRGNAILHVGNYSSYITQLLSPNGATVVAADSAMPSAGHSFIHTLGLGPNGNDGHILGMSWANTTSVYGAQIWVDTDPNNRMAFRSRSSAGTWTGWNEVIHSSNYNSYAPTLTGGGASGTWGISITGNADTVDGYHASSLLKLNEWNGNIYIHTDGRIYGTIFYDSNDTTYYVDPNSTSRLESVWVRGANFYDGRLYVGGSSAGSGLTMNFDQIWTGSGTLHLQYSGSGNIDMNYGGGYTFSRTSLRAPIFYDYDDTTYYGDFNGTSRFYQAIVFGDSSRYSAVSTTINGTGAGDKLILYGNTSNYDARVLVGTDYDFIFKSQGSPSNKGMFRFYSGNSAALALEIRADQNTYATATVYAAAYRGNANVGGTGEATWHPAGIYSGGTEWLYGTMYRNGSSTYYAGGWEYQIGGIEFNGGPSFQVNNSRNLQLNSGGAADVGIYGRGNGGQFAFQLYGDGGGSYGFLNGVWASWDLRKSTNGALYMNDNNSYYLQTNSNSYVYRLESATDLRAPIFYDSNDTSYYLDPNGESNLYRFTSSTMTRNGMNYLSINSPFTTRAAQSSGYLNGSMGWGTYDLNTIASYWGSGFIDSWGYPGNAPGGSSHYVGMQAMHYNNQNGNFHGWQMVCAQESYNRWFWRSSWDTPRSWVEMIHSGNIDSQSVSYASSAGNASTLGGLSSSSYMKDDGWNNYPGQDADAQAGMCSDFTYSNNAPWTGDLIRFGAGGYSLQLSSQYGGGGDGLSFRTRNGDGGYWNSWRRILNNSYDPYAANMNQYVRTSDSPTFNFIYANYNMRMGEMWGYGGIYRGNGDMMFGVESGGWRFHYQNVQKLYIGTDGSATFSGSVSAARFTSTSSSSASLALQVATGTGIFAGGMNIISFAANYMEKMRITSSEVLINTTATTQSAIFYVNGKGAFGSLYIGSLGTGTVYSNMGLLTNTNPSDYRLKNNIKPLTYGLNEILQLNPKTFYYNDDVYQSKLKYGFIAQEVKEVMPDLARKIENSEYLGLETEGIFVTLVNAIKEMKAELDLIKNK